MQGIGDRFQQETKYSRLQISVPRGWVPPAEEFKLYPDAKRVKLPEPESGGEPVWDVMAKRRSSRNFAPEHISFLTLNQLLWAVSGVTREVGGYTLRTVPSAGGLYPVETYLMVNFVEELSPGVYHLNVKDWELELLKEGEFGSALARACLHQSMMADASVNFIWTIIIGRNKQKYAERGYRYMYLDAGHIGQNLYLASTALGLGCCAVGAFYDEEVNSIVEVDGKAESAIYLACVGRVK